MSFSAEVKEELAEMVPSEFSLFTAELQGLLLYGAKLTEKEGGTELRFLSEHEESAKKYFTFIRKTDRIKTDFAITTHHPNGKNKACTALLSREDAAVLLESAALGYENGLQIGRKAEQKLSGEEERRAFLRGAFLAAGSVSDPERFYHLEFVCPDETKAWYLKLLLSALGETAGVVKRKGHYVVYLKDSDGIVALLGMMGASRALLALEEIRVMKEMRNRVNRTVNCETANLQKTVAAGLKQLEDIEYIRNAEGFDNLPSTLAEMAEIRLEYPDAPLKELGTYLNPPVGKSGVNHRLRKLS
ncbi:DNA-binding protein WhiA, partial [Stomatobaculum longum]|uniref:DNA-binding protein WhiA n=1 Tax=Stomatobaculum longum TaxID=796942 RepID=UPI0028DB4872